MKKIIILSVIFLSVFVKADSLSVAPSVYYTHGSYSNSNSSNSVAVFNTLQLSDRLYLMNSYDNLNINNPDWTYLQQFLTAGLYVNMFPFYLTFNYGHIKGDFDYKPFPETYSDYTNLYNSGFIYFYDSYYFGADYTYQNAIGFQPQKVNQLTLRIDKILSYDLFISFRPSFTSVSDGRSLYSASLKLNYLVSEKLLAKLGGFAGQRAFYFDSDLLTIFNQNETQKYQISSQLEYSAFTGIKLVLSYQYTAFKGYKINYISAGIKTNFFL